jgi:PhnB protein
MQLNPYLLYNGQCEAAFKFYQKCLGGNIVAMMTHEGTPAADNVPAEWRRKILHACLNLGDFSLMASDCPSDRFQKPQGFSVSLQIPDPTKAETVFNALAENGTITMPLEKTFWAQRFGMLTDQFGIPWMVNCA